MSTTDAEMPRSSAGVPYRPAQIRVIEAALDLFGEHGISGTSLQMIANEIGVTKAAVYHQFKTKDEIALAAAEFVLARLEQAVRAAEAEGSRAKAREVLIAGMVDHAVELRRIVGILQRDPVMIRFLEEHEPFRQVMQRLYRLLMGPRAGAEQRVRAAMLTASIAGAVIHPLAADLDDDTLRAQLLRHARRFMDLAD
jgi:AcrR family transcriptional regulator